MNWTKERPAGEGFYWLRGGRWRRATVIEVREAESDGVLYVRGCDEQLGGSWHSLEQFRRDAFEFSGPLMPPQ